MKKLLLSISVLALLTSCDIDKTKKGELPSMDVDVDVDADSGALPEFDVDWAEVNVGTRTKTVEVPKLVVVMEEEEIEVPYVDVDMPDDYADKEKIERSLMVSAEVQGKSHKIDIKEIRATQNKLFVIATLEEMGDDIGDQTMRVQDQIELNAPDLDVQYIVVGKRPNRTFNNQYTYVSSMDNLSSKVKGAKTIYED